MAYDEILAGRVRAILGDLPNLTEKMMFGGVGYLIKGNLACGVHKEFLIVRVGLERYSAVLQQPHIQMFDITGRPMTGWVMVAPEACQGEADLQHWVRQGLDFAATLAAK